MALPSQARYSTTMWWLTGLTVVAVLVVFAGLFLWLERRHRRMTAILLERIEELEGSLGDRPATASLPVERLEIADRPVDRTPTGDVLAGKTSHIARVIEGSGAEAVSLADQALVIVHRRLDEPITPNDVAEALYVSLRTLERGLAEELGCTPRQLILAVKMREARRMLRDGRYQVQEVAGQLGFASASHMSRRFKSFYRVSPSDMIPR